MRLYCEVDVPFDKRSSRSISSRTLLQHKKNLILDLGENPSIDPGISRLFFYHIWWRTRTSISVPVDFFVTFGGESGHESRYLLSFCYHIWWRTWASISVPLDFFLSHLVENPVPLVFLVTNMWSSRWTYKQQTQLLLNVTSFYRGNGIIAY
jgi:hypothetical protein